MRCLHLVVMRLKTVVGGCNLIMATMVVAKTASGLPACVR